MNQSEIPNPSDDISELFSDAPLWNRAAPLAAGYVAGSCGIIVGHPLDSLKVLLQTGGQTATPSSPATTASPAPTTTAASPVVPSVASNSGTTTTASSRNISTATISPSTTALIEKSRRPNRSFLSLYAGVGGPLLSIGLVQSLNFGMYDGFRRALYHFQNSDDEAHESDDYRNNDSLTNVAVSSTAAGAIISFVTSPLMVLKTKQQLMMWSMKKAAKDTLRHKGGVRNFFSGFGAHFFCDSLGRGVYFTSYEYFKRQIIRRNDDNTTNDDTPSSSSQRQFSISLPERMACAAASGMLCWTIIFPADVVRSKVIAHSALLPLDGAATRSSEMIRRLWNKDGFRPFFRGWGVTVARAGPVAAVVMPIYDLTLECMTRR